MKSRDSRTSSNARDEYREDFLATYCALAGVTEFLELDAPAKMECMKLWRAEVAAG
jgi:hypothetical protein